MKYDVIIIGGGIVGAATAWQLKLQYPKKQVLLLEKERGPALHQTGRNSGVIHAGVYYQPGSLKAQFCRQGVNETIGFCQSKGISYNQCGKLLVATDDVELERMHALFERCKQNQLSPELLSRAQLQKIEPNITGIGAFRVKETGIVDYARVTQGLLEVFTSAGGEVGFGQQITDLSENDKQVTVSTNERTYSTELVISCAGLMADKVIKMLGIQPDFQIVPFRGEYYKLSDKHKDVVNHLIYPIPDPSLPFLGVHLTKMIDGSITVGPNAVLAWKREGYKKTDFSAKDMFDLIKFKGFWPLMRRYRKSGVAEFRDSIFVHGYLQKVQKYCPQINRADLKPYPSGVRAQAVSNSGELIHDFKFVDTDRTLHVGNAPSPAATSAIPIAKSLIDRVREKL